MKPNAWILATALAVTCGCGGNSGAHADGGGGSDATHTVDAPDANLCQPVTPDPSFGRDIHNPLQLGGRATTDGMMDTSISDPDIHWDDAAAMWQLYYATQHAATCTTSDGVQLIRHATSTTGGSWTIDSGAALSAATGSAWDSVNTETPSVAVDPDADAAHRYVMVYSGASAMFPYSGYSFADYAIGVAFSADGVTFTRVDAASSPHAQAGLVLTGADVYPTALGAIVADPEIVVVGGVYHLWFSSFACDGTNCGTSIAYGIGHATSTDAIHWTPDATSPVASLLMTAGNATTGGGQPSVIYDATHCRWEMWLTNNLPGEIEQQTVEFNNSAGMWHATSVDGATWQIDYNGTRDLTWDTTAPGEDLGMLTGADIGARGNERLMMYVAFDDRDVPDGCDVPERTGLGYGSGVFTLDEAVRGTP